MPRILKTPLPQSSVLWDIHAPGDFIDGYSVDSAATVAEALETGFRMPGWGSALLSLRNRLVAPFGLKTGSGDGAALFPVTYESPSEMTIGTNDKHLDFRVALLRQDGRIHMATWVRPHNLAGRIYLSVVMPFHVLLSRSCLRRVARKYPA